MRFSCVALLVVAALLLLAVTSSPAPAQVAPGCGGVNYWLGDGFGGFGGHGLGRVHSSPYAMGRIPTPPYFALHPPVYYSYPVPRSYGYSPFAYPGIIATPEVVEPAQAQAAEVINPHVTRPAKASVDAAADDRTAQASGRMIVNPYVADRGLKAGVELSSLLKRSP